MASVSDSFMLFVAALCVSNAQVRGPWRTCPPSFPIDCRLLSATDHFISQVPLFHHQHHHLPTIGPLPSFEPPHITLPPLMGSAIIAHKVERLDHHLLGSIPMIGSIHPSELTAKPFSHLAGHWTRPAGSVPALPSLAAIRLKDAKALQDLVQEPVATESASAPSAGGPNSGRACEPWTTPGVDTQP